jgi:uncharacterized protein
MRRGANNIVFLFIILCATLLIVNQGSAPAAEKNIIILGTATPGGGFPAYGAVFADVINRADSSIFIEPRNTKGSSENIPLLEKGGLDIALVQGETLQTWLSQGSGASGLKIIAAMYSSPGMFAVKTSSPCRTIQDLKGLPVIFGTKGSGLIILSRSALKGIGLDQDRDFKAIYVDKVSEAPKMIAEGKAVALWGGGVGWPGFEALAKAPGGARFIAPTEEEIAMIVARYPLLRRLTIPANSYPGQSAPVVSVGSWSFVMARADLPEDVAYCIAKAIHRSETELAGRLPQARETTMANTLSAAPSRALIHPGVLRYMRESGMVSER